MAIRKMKEKAGANAAGRKKMALGRGLDALFPDMESIDNKESEFFQCDIQLIQPNRYQPRSHFSDEELRELSESIREQGLIQPLLVRKADVGYELIAGERRLRASKMAGLRQIPVVIRDVTDTELLEISIVENIQRQDLTPMEEAEAYLRLMGEFSLTQEQVALRVGKSRSAVANFLRLCQLPQPIKDSLNAGELSMGHARALLGMDSATQQKAAWKKIMSKNLSVRETESLVKSLKSGGAKPRKKAEHSDHVYFSSLEDELSRIYGTKVVIQRKGKTGKVEIEFYSDDDLDRLLGLLKHE